MASTTFHRFTARSLMPCLPDACDGCSGYWCSLHIHYSVYNGGSYAGAWSWSLTSTYWWGYECVELYLYSEYVFMACRL